MKKWLMIPAVLVMLAVASSARAQHGHGGHAACAPAPVVSSVITYEEVAVKTCVTAPDKKRTTKTVYACKCEDFCLKKCPSLLSRLRHRDCGDCGSGDCQECDQCDKPRSKKVLIKKFKVTEEDTTKCVVETRMEKVPVCAPACGTPVYSTPAKVELLPAPTGK